MIILKPEVEKDLPRLIMFLHFQVIIIMMIVLRILYQDDPAHFFIPLRIKSLRFQVIIIMMIVLRTIHYVCELISWD